MSKQEQRRAWVVSRVMAGELGVAEAARLLQLSERSIRRLRARMEREGPAALVHGNRGRVSPRRLSEATRAKILEAATAEKPGKVRRVKTYKLTPGLAHVYNEGDLHSPKRAGPTQLIRIEGVNMETVKRFKFQAV